MSNGNDVDLELSQALVSAAHMLSTAIANHTAELAKQAEADRKEQRASTRALLAVADALKAQNPTTESPPALQRVRTPIRGAHKHFDQFWAAYPKKVGKQAAYQLWPRAVEIVMQDQRCTIEEAAAFLTEMAGLYAQRLAATKTQKCYIKSPKNWLTQYSWQDDPECWGGALDKREEADARRRESDAEVERRFLADDKPANDEQAPF